MAQQSGNNTPGNVAIYAKNIDINTNSNSVLSAILAGNAGKSTLTLDASDTISIISNNSIAVTNYDQNKAPDNWHGTGESIINITGGKGVTIKSNASAGVYSNAMNGTAFTTNINAPDGDVDISGIWAVYLNNKNENGLSNSANITGKNITLTSISSNPALLSNGGNLTVNGTSSDSNIQINGDINALTTETGNAGTVIFKNGNINLEGKIGVQGKDSSITFANTTTTHVDSKYLTDQRPFIIAKDGGNVTIDGKMVIENIKTGTELKFTNDKSAINGTKNVVTTNALQDAVIDDSGKLKIQTVSADEAKKIFAGSVLTNTALAATANNHDSVTSLFDGKTNAQSVNNLNRVANFGELGGLSHSVYSVSNLFTDAIDGHYADVEENEKNIWAKYIHNKETIDGMSLGGMKANYDATYNGTVVGADFYQKDGNTAGIAVSYVDGDISGITRNDADYYGVSLYGRHQKDDFSLLGDITWLHGSNDLSQYTAGQVLKASPDINAFSIGVKALQDIQAGSGILTPYIGVRYMNISPDSYTLNNGLHYDADNQNLFLLPIGVDYSFKITNGDWTYRPFVGVGYLWTMGDRNSEQSVSLYNSTDTFGFDTTDANSFIAKVGFNAENDIWSFGAHYQYQNGNTTQSDKWVINAAYKF